MQNESREVFGSIESVALPSLGITNLIAKVDTGAWSGALHCTNTYERDGTLYFTPLGDPALATSTTEFETRIVRGATGHAVERYIIPVTLEIKGKMYETTLGLSDRQLLRREMLLGRRFLIENDILVDVKRTLDDDHEAEMYL
jgi:hypothetical protein